MASWVQIANLVMRRLGGDRIVAIDGSQDIEEARAFADVYESARDIVLRKHPWNCAMRRSILAPDGTAPAWGFTYAYSFPNDPYCLRVWGLSDSHHPIGASWQSENRKILTDEGPALYVRWIARVTDPELFDANLMEAIAAEIAYQTAFRITQSRTAEAKMKEWRDATLPTARTADAQEGQPPDDDDDGDFISARV